MKDGPQEPHMVGGSWQRRSSRHRQATFPHTRAWVFGPRGRQLLYWGLAREIRSGTGINRRLLGRAIETNKSKAYWRITNARAALVGTARGPEGPQIAM